MFGSFLIFLREGIEGSIIIAVICAYLSGIGRRDLFRPVMLGTAAAVASSAVAGGALYTITKTYFVGSTVQAWFETVTFLVAVIVLTYMTFWMKHHARDMSGMLRDRVNAAVSGGSAFALALLAFATVGREAVETMIFLLAIALQSSALALLTGAIVGLAISIGLSVAIYRLGVRFDMRALFTCIGAALIVVSAGLLANVIQNLQEMHVLLGSSTIMWNTSRVISDKSPLGDILHGLFGYSASPSLLQVACWGAYLCIALALFLRRPGATKQSGVKTLKTAI